MQNEGKGWNLKIRGQDIQYVYADRNEKTRV
jgi:hypothetical protein